MSALYIARAACGCVVASCGAAFVDAARGKWEAQGLRVEMVEGWRGPFGVCGHKESQKHERIQGGGMIGKHVPRGLAAYKPTGKGGQAPDLVICPGPNDTAENGIYLGDTRQLLRCVPDGSVDIVFTSPPYNAGIKYPNWNDEQPEDLFWRFQREWLTGAFRVTGSGGRLYCTVSDKMLWKMRDIAVSVGWRFHQLLVWCKPNFAGSSGRISGDWTQMAEWCLLFHRTKQTPMLSEVFGVTTHNWIVEASTQSNFNGVRERVHPAQMAFDVAFAWLARTPGNVVLDPFVGKGTTAMAAKALGKQWIGFDNAEGYVTEARQRIAQLQPPLIVTQQQSGQLALFDAAA